MTSLDRKLQHTCPGGITCKMCREPRKARVKLVRAAKKKMRRIIHKEIRDES